MTEIRMSANDIEITIKGESEHFFDQDLFTKAVVTLIEQADIHGWEKHNAERGRNPNALGDFCAAVLTAVAHLYVRESPVPEDYEPAEVQLSDSAYVPPRKHAHEILTGLIEDLRESDYLNEEVTSDYSEDDDDFFTLSSK
jgi:hypothetical protein